MNDKPKAFDMVERITLLICLLFFSAMLATKAELDLDNNGLSDVWEKQFAPIPMPIDADPDGDGQTTAEEENAGTNPADPASVFRLEQVLLDDTAPQRLRLQFPADAGRTFGLQITADMNDAEFADHPPSSSGTGGPLVLDIDPSGQAILHGGLRADLWAAVPSDVSEPEDLKFTTVAPDVQLGLSEFNDNAIQFPYAAIRIHGIVRQLATDGQLIYSLSSQGPSVFELDPTGPSGDALAPLLRDESGKRELAPPVNQEAGDLHAVSLGYLSLHPENPFVRLTWQRPGDSGQLDPSCEELLAWFDEDNALSPFVAGNAGSFRIKVLEPDSDQDGVSDWEELLLGLSPIHPATDGQTDDAAVAAGILEANNVVRVVQTELTQLFESEQNSRVVTLERVISNGQAFTLPLWVSGEGELSDLSLSSPAVQFAAGQRIASITVRAVDDGRLEPDEPTTLHIGSTATDVVTGFDYVPLNLGDETSPEPILYVARYGPQGDAVRSAHGFASILLAADRKTALVSSEFNNLTSPQTVAHIHLESDHSVVEGLPTGTYTDHLWQLTTAANMDMNMPGMVMNDGSLQSRLDALDGNGLYANVHSTSYPAGEIRGTFFRADGAIEFEPPPHLDPDPGAPNPSETDAFRFLEQATFGPTAASVTEVVELGIADWIDAEIAKPMSSSLAYQLASDAVHRDITGQNFNQAQPTHRRNLTAGWFTRAIHGKDQLRQRMAFAWSEIFVVSILNSTITTRTYGAGSYADMLAENAFGNFRDFLEDITRHPIMGVYLSALKNEKANPAIGNKPDENFAREIMQLFSIGLLERHPDGTLRYDQDGRLIQTYTNSDITELARVFTGMSFGEDHLENENGDFYYYGGPIDRQTAYMRPMKLFAAYHDNGAKTILKDVQIPANLSPEADLDAALDAIFNHPNTPPFISRLLIQRLVTSNPSRGYIYRVARAFEDDGAGVRGNLTAVTKAIFLDQEARSPAFYNQNNFGKLKEPLIAHIQACRAVGVTNNLPLADVPDRLLQIDPVPELEPALDLSHYDAGALRYAWINSDYHFGQTPLRQPSVFNWFLPDYTPGGTMRAAQLYAPEFQIATDNNMVLWLNNSTALPWTANSQGFNTGDLPGADTGDDNIFLTLRHLDALNRTQLVDWCDRHLRGGRMSPLLRHQLEIELAELNFQPVEGTIALLLNSPEFWIQR